ncbi:hypothetical protein AGMMS49546_29710 [Spirochaetia bacterium]|nr:hypothetical protein AGMMS49546_29710 [Spirochaetia bacterium]
MNILVECLNYLKGQSPIIAFITAVGIIVAGVITHQTSSKKAQNKNWGIPHLSQFQQWLELVFLHA